MVRVLWLRPALETVTYSGRTSKDPVNLAEEPPSMARVADPLAVVPLSLAGGAGVLRAVRVGVSRIHHGGGDFHADCHCR